MVALINAFARRPATFAAQATPPGMDQWHRLEQAAGFSMVAFEAEDDVEEQLASHAGLWDGEIPGASEAHRLPGRMAALIDDCAAVVTSYLRPAF